MPVVETDSSVRAVRPHAGELGQFIADSIKGLVRERPAATRYREPLVAFAPADDPRFLDLRRIVDPTHLLPSDLLPGARSVVAFFLPFERWVVEANAQSRDAPAVQWARAYLETNALIGFITESLILELAKSGVRAAAEPATHNYDPLSLVCRWSHKSAAVIAGLGSFGLHQMVITDAGCAGRFGSMVLDEELAAGPLAAKQRCLYFHDGSCLECVSRCPAQALDPGGPIDKQRCNRWLLANSQAFRDLGVAHVCGKCAIGPCSFESAVP
jgi:epoxyqueuosine reductase